MASTSGGIQILAGSPNDISHALTLNERFKAATSGFQSGRVLLNADNPNEGVLTTQWDSLDSLNKFRKANPDAFNVNIKTQGVSVTSTGPLTVLTSGPTK